MPQITIISDEVRTVEADATDGRVLLDRDQLPAALGWTLKPEGLCRDGVCLAVADVDAMSVDGKLDLASVAAALKLPSVVDGPAGLAAVALPAERRLQALDELRAPAFTLADLDGRPHPLEEWQDRKKLLVAFATW
jgi:hypothetical protein